MSSHADEETKSTDVVMADAQPPALAAAPAGPISAASIAPATPAAAQNVIQMFLHHLQAAGLDLRKCLDDGDREHQRPTRGLHQSLGGGVPPWRLDQPHSFKNRLERHCATLSPADILQFVSGVKEFAADERRFVQLLLPTQPSLASNRPMSYSQRTSADGQRAATYSQQDSLMRLLILIEPLQLQLVKFLLKKLQAVKASHPRDPHPLAPLILAQLRYLDQVYDSRAITNEFKSTATKISEPEVLSAMIQAVPEVISQEHHQNMVVALIELYQTDDRQIVSVLDTLLHLQMSAQKTGEVISEMLATLTTKPVTDLPVIVRFIVQASGNLVEMRGGPGALAGENGNHHAAGGGAAAASSAAPAPASSGRGAPKKEKKVDDQLAQTLATLRKQLNASRLVNASVNAAVMRHAQPRHVAAETDQSAPSDPLTAPRLTVQALQQSIRFHPVVGDCWLKELQGLKTSEEPTAVDIWMMFLLYGFPNLQEKVFGMMKKKISEGVLQGAQMIDAIEAHSTVMHSLFSTILALCDALLRTNDVKCHRIGVQLQSACFAAFNDSSSGGGSRSRLSDDVQADRARIIDAFVQQIGNTTQEDTCNAALAELWHLVHQHPQAVGRYRDQINAINDYLSNFTPEQINILAEIMAVVAVTIDTPPPSLMHDDGDTMMHDADGASSSARMLTIAPKFMINLTKTFGSNVLLHHRIGVYFVAGLLKYIGAPVLSEQDSTLQLRAANAAEEFAKIFHDALLHLEKLAPVHAESRRSQLYHLMADAIEAGAIHTSLLELFVEDSEKVIKSFMSSFALPLQLTGQAAKETIECSPSLWLNLQAAPEKLFTLFEKLADPASRPFVHSLHAAARLYLVCRKADDLLDAGVESFLGTTPLMGFDTSQFPQTKFSEDISADSQYLLVSTLIHALNLQRSIASAFAGAQEKQALVGTRVRHAMKLEQKMKSMVGWMRDLIFIPYGLTEDSTDEVRDSLQTLLDHQSERAAKSEGKKGSGKVKELTEEEFLEPLDQVLQPWSFDVFSLLTLPLTLQKDTILSSCFHHAPPKRAKLVGLAAANEAALARASELVVLPMAEEKLSVDVLAYLLGELEVRVEHTIAHAGDPLLTAKWEPQQLQTDVPPPQNTFSSMTPFELTRALVPVWTALGSHTHALVTHLLSNQEEDGVAEEAEDGTALAPAKKMVESVISAISVVNRLLLGYATSPDPEDAHCQLVAECLAAFTSTFDEAAVASPVVTRRNAAEGSLAFSCQSLMYLLKQFGKTQSDLQSPQGILQVMETVLQVTEHEVTLNRKMYRGVQKTLQDAVSTFAREVLEMQWDEDSKLNAKHLSHAMKLALENGENFGEACHEMLESMSIIFEHHLTKEAGTVPVVELPDECIKFARNMILKNAPMYLKPLLESLTSHMLHLDPKHYRGEIKQFFSELEKLSRCLALFDGLIGKIYMGTIAEVQSSTPMLASVLRQGKLLMEGMVKQKQAHFQEHLKEHKSHISTILTNVQKFATLMQVVCVHGKKMHISGLSAHIPMAKAASQSLFSMVKTIFGANELADAVTSKTLDHSGKTLHAGPKKKAQGGKGGKGQGAGGKKRKKGQESDEEEEENEEEKAEDEEESEEEEEQEEEEAEEEDAGDEETEAEDACAAPPPQKKQRSS